MLDQVVGIYIIIDDILKTIGHQKDIRCKMSDSKALTTQLVLNIYFGGNQSQGRVYLKSEGHIPQMLSASRFNRRLHRSWDLILSVFHLLAAGRPAGRFVQNSFFAQTICSSTVSIYSKIMRIKG